MSANPDNPQPSHRKVVGKETQKLKVLLSEHEKRNAHEGLIACLSELAAHEREATEVKAQLARKQKGLEAKRGNLHQLIVAGYEYRDVAVERIADFDRGLVLLVRVDTGEEVDIERMSESQKQTELDLRDKAQNDAARPTNPDDVNDGDPWGAPSDGRAPIAELPPPDGEIIDAEFVEGDGGPDGSADQDDDETGLNSDDLRVKHLVEWLPSQGEATARELLEGYDVEDVRAIYARVLGEPAGRAQKRTMIPKIIDKLFNAPF